MKKRMTSTALVVAMTSAMGVFAQPRLTVEANHVSSVPMASARKTKMYVSNGVMCCGKACSSAMRDSKVWNEIQEGEKKDPNDVHEVPVEAHHLDGSVVLRTEIPAPRAPDHPQQQT